MSMSQVEETFVKVPKTDVVNTYTQQSELRTPPQADDNKCQMLQDVSVEAKEVAVTSGE